MPYRRRYYRSGYRRRGYRPRGYSMRGRGRRRYRSGRRMFLRGYRLS